jgi:NDP-sugar pyrophosphorylase family protein
LYPETENCPKPLLPVAGKPILEHIINRAKGQGFSQFIISLNYLGHMIEDYFGSGESLDVHISYLRESTPLGTAGALGLLNPIPNSAFVVTNGDVITDISYGDIVDYHGRHGAVATMAVRKHSWKNPFGVVTTHGELILSYKEKPESQSNINAGVYVIEPSALTMMKKSAKVDMSDFFQSLLEARAKIVAYPIYEQWFDVGLPDDLHLVRAVANELEKE